jgi:hypothetical protein
LTDVARVLALGCDEGLPCFIDSNVNSKKKTTNQRNVRGNPAKKKNTASATAANQSLRR